MSRITVIAIFTLEGFISGLLALVAGAVYGIPLLLLTARKGLPLLQNTEDYGFAISDRLFPSYPAGLIAVTVLVVMVTVTIVS